MALPEARFKLRNRSLESCATNSAIMNGDIKPMLPNKPRGVRRDNDRRVLNGINVLSRGQSRRRPVAADVSF
jgi:hypothetical protein